MTQEFWVHTCEHIKCTEVKYMCNKAQIDARHIVIHVQGATDSSVHSGHK